MPRWIKLSGLARCGLAPVCSENRCLDVTFWLNLTSCGRPWSYRTTFSTIPRSRDEKSSKITSKWRLGSTFRTALASFWLHFAGSAVTWQALFALFAKSSATLCGKAGFSYIDTTPTRNAMFWRSGHPSWSHLGRKVEPDRSKMASAWGQDNQIWQVSSVLL